MKISTIDDFVPELDLVALESPHATFYHSRTWLDALRAVYARLSLRCIVAERDGRPVGYLPYFVSRRGPLRRVWSLPFGTYGGPVCVDDDASAPLLDAYSRVMSSPGVVELGWVDFRRLTRADDPDLWSEAHLVDLTAGFDRVWKGFPSKRRQQARAATRRGVVVERRSDTAALREYHRIFRSKVEGAGVLHPERLYAYLLQNGGDSVRLYLAVCDGEIYGGHINFYYKDTVIAWTGGVSSEHARSQAGSLLISECMRMASEEGFATYNLGASLGKPSLARFKETLGGVAHRYPVHVTRSWLGRLAGLGR